MVLSKIHSAGKITQPSSFDPGTIQSCQGGTQGSFVEKCNTASIAVQKLVSRQPLSCIKERWGQQISNKFETSEQFHPILEFQNGRIEFITKCAPEGRLHMQA